MEIIITPDRISAHKIVKYGFKHFDSAINAAPKEGGLISVQPRQKTEQIAASTAVLSEEKETLAAIRASQDAENNLVVDLVKKVENFADSVVALESRLEKQEAEFAARLAEEKKRAYEEGKKDGEAKAADELTSEADAHKSQLKESIGKLDTALKDFSAHTASLEKELSSVALEIAQEVIASEVAENPSKIAKSLSFALLNEIKDALKITIKVSPDEQAELANALKDDSRVQVVADRAVLKGGVIVISDAGSIDAQLHNRFTAIKKSILEGGQH